MSQNVAPVTPVPIEGPGRLELFWDKNKRLVFAGLVATAVAIGLHYFLRYQDRRATDAAWSALSTSANLVSGYGKPHENWSFYEQFVKQNPQFLGSYISSSREALVSDIDEALSDVKVAELEKLAAGTDARAPLALWALAGHEHSKQRFTEAEARLSELEKRFAGHFLCVQSAYPVQWRDEVTPPDGEKKPERKPGVAPELLPPVAGSPLSAFRAKIAADRAFHEQQKEFFAAPEPDSERTATFEFEGAGSIKIRFFAGRSPDLVAKFLDLCAQDGGWWVGQRVHQLERSPSSETSRASPSHFVFGWQSSKDEDRANWKAEDPSDEHKADYLDSGVSHFPFSVSLESAGEGKVNLERVYINAEDEARLADGQRVVIGRVVEGMEVVREIVDAEFVDDAARTAGRGRPLQAFTIKSIKVE
jgi:cyclophilin family peptidyl-prolyl cis-trans isomerase